MAHKLPALLQLERVFLPLGNAPSPSCPNTQVTITHNVRSPATGPTSSVTVISCSHQNTRLWDLIFGLWDARPLLTVCWRHCLSGRMVVGVNTGFLWILLVRIIIRLQQYHPHDNRHTRSTKWVRLICGRERYLVWSECVKTFKGANPKIPMVLI